MVMKLYSNALVMQRSFQLTVNFRRKGVSLGRLLNIVWLLIEVGFVLYEKY